MRLAAVLAALHEAFDDAEFPEHRGLHAAMLCDRWIDDPKILFEATGLYDKRCHWSELPFSYLSEGSLGATYLDAMGYAFYLPAYIRQSLFNGLGRYGSHFNGAGSYDSTMFSMISPPKDIEMYEQYFLPRVELISDARIRACRFAFHYIYRRTELDEMDPSVHDEMGECLASPFWQVRLNE